MTAELTASERRKEILFAVNEKAEIPLKRIADKYKITTRTVRRDCKKLGLVVKGKTILRRDREIVKNDTLPVPTSLPSKKAKTRTPQAVSGPASQKAAPLDPRRIMAKIAMNGNFQAAKYMIENEDMFLERKTLPEWERPRILNNRQNEIVDAICDDSTKVIFIEGDRRTGKSTAVYVAINENCWNGKRTKWGMWAQTENSCIKIHNDMYYDKITWDETHKLTRGHSAKKTRFINGGLLETHATKPSDSSGQMYTGIWIDEFHLVLRESSEAVATIAGIIRSEENLKIVISCNRGAGVYEAFKDMLSPFRRRGTAKFFTLLKSDTKHITEENDELTRAFMVAAEGEDFAKRQLDNEHTGVGDPFPWATLQPCLTTLDVIMEAVENKNYTSAVGVDPGFMHRTGVCHLVYYQSNIYELESLLIGGKETSEERLKVLIKEMAYEARNRSQPSGAMIKCESNSGGLHWMRFWSNSGMRTEASNFGSDDSARSNHAMVKRIVDFMHQGRVHLYSDDLKKQLLKYNPDKGKDDENKGDLADAFIHAAYHLIELSEEGKHRKTTWF